MTRMGEENKMRLKLNARQIKFKIDTCIATSHTSSSPPPPLDSSPNPPPLSHFHHSKSHNLISPMAIITASLLFQPTPLKWNQPHPRPLLSFPPKSLHLIPQNSRSQLKCFKVKCLSLKSNPETKPKLTVQPGPIDKFLNALKALSKPAITAVLLGLVLMSDPNSALAASGGRVGGKSFSSRSSSGSSSSRTYSVPRTSRPDYPYSAPYYAPSPFGFGGGGGGFYMGPAVGVGVGAGSSFFLILTGFAAFVLVSGFLSDRSEGSVLTATEKTTVMKLQVGLLGLARELQRDLDRIADMADTSTPEGLSYVVTETTLALLRHPDYCISGYSSVALKRSIEDAEKSFNQLSIEERGKFDEETLVNVNSIRKRSSTRQRSNGFRNEYIVITILVAAEGEHKLPAINGSNNLKEALQKLASIPSNKIMAVEVLWTPQNEDDTLSERELLEDYPLLRPL